MHSKLMVLATLLMLMPATICYADEASDSPSDVQGVEEATTAFYSALNTMFTGDGTPMESVWSHADDVTYMGPTGGILVGWEQVQTIWESQAALKLGGEVLPEDVHTTVVGDLAVVQNREVGSNFDANGQPVDVSIRATSTFRKENGQWKMIGHHTDLLPFLNQE